jgi:hypothetical protein
MSEEKRRKRRTQHITVDLNRSQVKGTAVDMFDRLTEKELVRYNPVYRRISNSTVAAIFLSQAMFLQMERFHNAKLQAIKDEHGQMHDGFWFHTQAQWEQETGLSRDEQETARDQLIRLGFLSEAQFGLPARLYFRVNRNRVIQAVADLKAAQPVTPASSTPQPRVRHQPNLECGISPTEETHGRDSVEEREEPALAGHTPSTEAKPAEEFQLASGEASKTFSAESPETECVGAPPAAKAVRDPLGAQELVARKLAEICYAATTPEMRALLSKGVLIGLRKQAQAFDRIGIGVEQLDRWLNWWKAEHFAGKKGSAPSPKQIGDTWAQSRVPTAFGAAGAQVQTTFQNPLTGGGMR